MAASAGKQAPRLTLRERNRLRTRRELLDAALEVFAEAGYGSASVENIAERAGAAKGTLYTYFPQGREQLFCELYEEVNDQLIDRANDVYSSEGDFASRIVAMTEAIAGIAAQPRLGRFYAIDDPALDQALTFVRGHASSVIAQYIAHDYQASVSATQQDTPAEHSQVVAELLTGAMRSALTSVARGNRTADDVARAMRTLAEGVVPFATTKN
ncbi:helix-turn-helix transcriptional regulator [Rhodococcus sp. BP-252]|uniref:TetR/AcrR family transcriptional regulator n=1 Tax=unclassified Rhodococcus (in: high G+C Gram-positive bacteria) TaxID=192944 RepID=UPI001C9A9F49|nr:MULTISPECIES: TetR/AcrR family transcriptional regulator [unclassified Rhodococcus (in: high G+C Gram-positive bacteria)]MBY6414647.1 helix-turn-helix transcriptional regulator [Rhodococcus sp. BP-320]MBY6419472.1 helix-turn-helix transcriptional regulator [Rhodococcus sp. BP-321]MBY6424516.1 helix-turn-helix transcriptional regulator [Rhodococcus sp. BP-324]MBY6429483.1 helix-turn-helix transcriptional regulator [Rhodococcus sp. BP-323]MBY6434526.1 helix-turn-helix transcriptional regulato